MNNQLSCTNQCETFMPEVTKTLSALSLDDVLKLDKHLKISGLSKSCYMCVLIGLKKMKLNESMKILGVDPKEFATTVNNAIDLKNPSFLLSAIENFENLEKNREGEI